MQLRERNAKTKDSVFVNFVLSRRKPLEESSKTLIGHVVCLKRIITLGFVSSEQLKATEHVGAI